MDKRLLVNRLVTLVAIFAVLMVVHNLILGNSTVVKLSASQPFGGQAAQALGLNESGALWQPGSDFATTTNYLLGGQWAVVEIKPSSKNSFDPVTAIFEKISGVYRLEAGPSGFFSYDIVQQLPSDVTNYLAAKGMVNGTIPE